MAAPSSPEPDAPQHDDHRLRRRRVLELSWVIGVVAFVLVRFVLAYSALAKYDQLTVWVFGILDLGTAVPYAIGTARLVTSLVDRDLQGAARWGTLASACFLAPYVWIAWAGRDGEFPTVVYVVVALLAVSLGVNAIYGIRRRVRVERAEALERAEISG
ncbi:MAG: hypothetical protein R2746_03615 [Acidimicrobiales bacterium]